VVLGDILPDEPDLADALLVCATEVTTDVEIDRFAAALTAELASLDVGASGPAVDAASDRPAGQATTPGGRPTAEAVR